MGFRLVTFGDSYVEGFIKLPKKNTEEERAKINFTQKLYEMPNNIDAIENCGRHGASNKRIAYRIFKRLRKGTQGCFFLICWSSPERLAYYCPDRQEYVMLPKEEEYVGKKIDYVFESNMLIFGIHAILDKLKIPHAQINAFTPIIGGLPTKCYIDANYINAEYHQSSLLDIIAERYMTNDHEPFIPSRTFIKNSKYITECMHPTEEGNVLIAKTLSPIIENYWEQQFRRYNG